MFLKRRTGSTMNRTCDERRDGYRETIDKGIRGLRNFGRHFTGGTGTKEGALEKLAEEIRTADAIVIGAGSGLSTSTGFTYSGERFDAWFSDFAKRYGFRDMYSGGFYPYPREEEFWAYWARYIYINRYIEPPKPVYRQLFALVKDIDYFVVTTNVDHCFQKAGFDKKRLFYTQGDYGLFQSRNPENHRTYDNESWVMEAMKGQGFIKGNDGLFHKPKEGGVAMEIPSSLIPTCPDDSSPVAMNLRCDDSFVEDEGWHRASAAYADFLHSHEGKHLLYLELGVGANTPVIIKYPFWQMTRENRKARYCCINYGEAFCPEEVEDRSLCIDGDIGEILTRLGAGK
jgi:NAD-dependent SIR2 family protein deacetylase